MGKNKRSRAKRSLSRPPKGLPVRGGGASSSIGGVNPFERAGGGGPHGKRPKYDVHNRGNGNGARTEGTASTTSRGPSSLLAALRQRQEVVRAERTALSKSNAFYDRRLTAATPQEQALQRLVKERHAVSKRRTKFQLNDGDDDDDGNNRKVDRRHTTLTHRGTSIQNLRSADHVILSDDEEDYGDLDQLDTDLHFGGGALGGAPNPYGPGDMSSSTGDRRQQQLSLLSTVYAGRKTELDDLIVRRKLAKAERLKSKEEQVETFDKFDDEYKELAGLLQFRDKRSQPNPHTDTGDDDDMAEWGRQMNTLQLQRKVAATNRTKTEEEVAKEEADRLHELETRRLARMNGDFDDDDLSDVSVVATETRPGGDLNARTRQPHPEDLDDDDADGKDGGATKKNQHSMKFTADGLVKVDAQGMVLSDDAGNGREHPGAPSAIHPVGTRVAANYHAAEQLEGYSAWYEGVVKRVHRGKGEGDVTYDVDYDDGDFEEGVQPRHVRVLDGDAPADAHAAVPKTVGEEDKTVKLKRQKAKEQARASIPFVFEVPTTLDALNDMIATHAKTGEDASLIIRRIHVANSVKLDRRNAEKMQNFYDVLLRRLVAVGDAIHQSGDGGPELGRFQQLDSLAHVLYLMAQDNGDSAAAVWGRRLGFFQSAHAKRLRDAELENDDDEDDDAVPTAWPSTGVFLALRALGHVFPVTDQRHHVVTPTILFLGQVVSHTPIESVYDLVMGLLFTGLLIEYNKEAKRVVPEALAFLGGVLRLFAPHPSDKVSGLFSHPALGAAASLEPFASLRESAASYAIGGDGSLPRLSLHKDAIDRTASCSTAVLVASLELVTVYAQSLPTGSRECYSDIANALCALQPRDAVHPLPKATWSALSTAISAVESHENAAGSRPPLRRRSAPTVVSIKSLAPRLEGSVTSKKKRSRGEDGNAVTTALRHELQRETKAAKRELQWDATLVEQLRRSEQAKRDEAASSKRHRAFAWLEQQQGELNQQVRQGGGLLKGGGVGAARAKARSGKLGMKKGGKL